MPRFQGCPSYLHGIYYERRSNVDAVNVTLASAARIAFKFYGVTDLVKELLGPLFGI